MKIPLADTLLFFCASLFFPCADVVAGGFTQPTKTDTTTPHPILTTLLSPLPVNVSAPTGQPISSASPTAARSTLPATAPVILRVINDSGLRNYANIVLDWELRANGVIRQKGTLANLPIAPKRPANVRLPVRIPAANSEELYLGLTYHYRTKPAQKPTPATAKTTNSGSKPTSPVPSLLAMPRPLSEEQFQLKPWSGNQLPIRPAGELFFTDENGLFTVQSPLVVVRFDKQTGWLLQYTVKDSHLLEDTPGLRTRTWLEPADPGNTATPHLQLFSTSTGSQLVIVRAEYTLPETSCLLHLSYSINAAGDMLVEQSMEADSNHQEKPLPCFGMSWILPAGFDSVTAYGQMPDKSITIQSSEPAQTSAPTASSTPGIYRFPVTPSRETGGDKGVRWWKIFNHEGKGLLFTADSALLTINIQPGAGPQTNDYSAAGLRINIDPPAAPYQLHYENRRYAWKVSPVPPEESPHR